MVKKPGIEFSSGFTLNFNEFLCYFIILKIKRMISTDKPMFCCGKRAETVSELEKLCIIDSEWMVQGTTPMCGAGDPWQPNWKPELAERSSCHGETRVLQNDSQLSCCPGHLGLAGICFWSDCSSNRSEAFALVGCQGPALSHSLTNGITE